VFERFTDQARRVVVLAQEESRLLGHNAIGPEHLLLGLVHEGQGTAGRALDAVGVTLDGVRAQVVRIDGRGESPPSGHIPFTPGAKKILELALREALQLGNNYIGTEHVLLGVLREDGRVVHETLAALGTDPDAVRRELARLMAAAGPRTQPTVVGGPASAGAVPLSAELGAVLGEAIAIAEAAGEPSVTPAHVILAAVERPDGRAADMLRAAGVDLDDLRRRLRGEGGGPGEAEPQE
jgi:ATP-dependent Clp protease ATP-binding subunit ClpC